MRMAATPAKEIPSAIPATQEMTPKESTKIVPCVNSLPCRFSLGRFGIVSSLLLSARQLNQNNFPILFGHFGENNIFILLTFGKIKQILKKI